MRVLLLPLVLLLATGAARGEYILLTPTEAAVAGQPISLYLMITNETEQTIDVVIPVQLDLRLTVEGRAFNVSFGADPAPSSATVQLALQTFRKIRYRGTLPAELEGAVTVRARGLESNSLVLAVQGAAPAALVAQEQPVKAPTTSSPPFFSALSAYDPMYFALGVNSDATAKFQLSLKLQFFTEDAPLARRAQFLHDLYFGYTQTSLWNLGEQSSPFYDTSYQPRLFYFTPDIWQASGRNVRLGVESGLGHESNGRGGVDSRSVSVAYVKPTLSLGDPSGWHWTVAPKLLGYLNKSDNPDIDNYRGYAELQVTYGKIDSWQIQVWGRKGPAGFSTQLDFTYPLPGLTLGNLTGYFLIQYFDGYGESILAYNQRAPSQLRFGLAVIR
jgi:outer membrane phospholipase A